MVFYKTDFLWGFTFQKCSKATSLGTAIFNPKWISKLFETRFKRDENDLIFWQI